MTVQKSKRNANERATPTTVRKGGRARAFLDASWTSWGYYLTLPQKMSFTLIFALLALAVMVLFDTLFGGIAILLAIYFVWDRDQSLTEWEKKVVVTLLASVFYFSFTKIAFAFPLLVAYMFLLWWVWHRDFGRGYAVGGVWGGVGRILKGSFRRPSDATKRRLARFMSRTLLFQPAAILIMLVLVSGQAAAYKFFDEGECGRGDYQPSKDGITCVSGEEVWKDCRHSVRFFGIGIGNQIICDTLMMATNELKEAVNGDLGGSRPSNLIACNATGTWVTKNECWTAERELLNGYSTKSSNTNDGVKTPPRDSTAAIGDGMLDAWMATSPRTGSSTLSLPTVFGNAPRQHQDECAVWTREDLGKCDEHGRLREPGKISEDLSPITVAMDTMVRGGTPMESITLETVQPVIQHLVQSNVLPVRGAPPAQIPPNTAPLVDIMSVQVNNGIMRAEVDITDNEGGLREAAVFVKDRGVVPTTVLNVYRSYPGEVKHEATIVLEDTQGTLENGDYDLIATATDDRGIVTTQHTSFTVEGAASSTSFAGYGGGSSEPSGNLRVSLVSVTPLQGKSAETEFVFTVKASHTGGKDGFVSFRVDYGDGEYVATGANMDEPVAVAYVYPSVHADTTYEPVVTAKFDGQVVSANFNELDVLANLDVPVGEGGGGDTGNMPKAKAMAKNYLPYLLWGAVGLIVLAGGFLYARQQGHLTKFGIEPKESYGGLPPIPGMPSSKPKGIFGKLKGAFTKEKESPAQAYAQRMGLMGPPQVNIRVESPDADSSTQRWGNFRGNGASKKKQQRRAAKKVGGGSRRGK